MSLDWDLKQRESKRKIFLQESHKSRVQDRPTDSVLPSKKSSMKELPPHSSSEQPRHKHEDLQGTIKQLKTLLKEQQQKYDQLFEEYEQLIEKNSLIEKEYINLKYEHSKEVKNMKKTYKEKVDQEIQKCIQDFMSKMNEEALWQSIKIKIQKFVSNIQRISQIFLQKSKKYQNKDASKSIDILQLSQSIKLQGSKLQKSDLSQIAQEQKILTSPSKDHLKELDLVANSGLNAKQIVFQDQYYGDLDDYEHLEEKINQRKNYELLKNCNRNSSDFRRKKIFNKGSHFQ